MVGSVDVFWDFSVKDLWVLILYPLAVSMNIYIYIYCIKYIYIYIYIYIYLYLYIYKPYQQKGTVLILHLGIYLHCFWTSILEVEVTQAEAYWDVLLVLRINGLFHPYKGRLDTSHK